MCHKLFGVFFIETSQCVVFTLSSMPGCPPRFIQGYYLLWCLNHKLQTAFQSNLSGGRGKLTTGIPKCM